jgi:hypothetical protein
MDILFNVCTVLDLPECDRNGIGTTKPTTRTRRYRFGSNCQLWTALGSPLVTLQNRTRDRTRGMLRKVAMR